MNHVRFVTCVTTLMFVTSATAFDGARAFSSCGRDRNLIALTFDDGPFTGRGGTERILRQLQGLGIPATFYITPAAMGDDDLELGRRCDLIRRQVADGHSVQMHSWEHKMIKPNTTNDAIVKDIARVGAFLHKCGANPNQFRPPYGVLSARQADLLGQAGLVVAMWNVSPGDTESKSLTSQQLLNRVMDAFNNYVGLGNSAVVLLHDHMFVHDERASFLPMVHRQFTSMGYEFVTTDECYRRCDSPICTGAGGPPGDPGVFDPKFYNGSTTAATGTRPADATPAPTRLSSSAPPIPPPWLSVAAFTLTVLFIYSQ
ncbi:NodB homology domain-containing protein [Plasmodiophora brassicae]|uniref:NodB homology domain-containing protein n=1 Tax=Plasmodiophora brassicae TaxID=37360 RepID=A0A0G4IV35_PLABS|nr:secrectory protein [Plasmodiophora brassicae]CEO98976.1 hypothetical protein PBRA_007090 [Plasmodiophora brassicae]SPQ95747.1 unnamed protein product [Plasmodiophora brassicae]